MKGSKQDFDIERFFRALADYTRLRLLNLMGDDEVCVRFFVEVIGTNQRCLYGNTKKGSVCLRGKL
jgi:hypothetical protein